jgi:hypothetical protein
MHSEKVSTYHFTIDEDNNLGLRPEFLVNLYMIIDFKSKEMAPQNVRNELAITQDGRMKTKFYIALSNRMAPYFINAVQQQINIESALGLRSYLTKLQEQVMSQLFGSEAQGPINIQFDTSSFFPSV